jgi:hypothetical protein
MHDDGSCGGCGGCCRGSFQILLLLRWSSSHAIFWEDGSQSFSRLVGDGSSFSGPGNLVVSILSTTTAGCCWLPFVSCVASIRSGYRGEEEVANPAVAVAIAVVAIIISCCEEEANGVSKSSSSSSILLRVKVLFFFCCCCCCCCCWVPPSPPPVVMEALVSSGGWSSEEDGIRIGES